MTLTTQQIHQKIMEVPERIRSWLGSTQVAQNIGNIISHFKIPEEKSWIIPRLILRIEIKDLHPEHFLYELIHQLNLTQERAKALANEIHRYVFKPVEMDLKQWGIDINLLDKYEIPVVPKENVINLKQTTKQKTESQAQSQNQIKPIKPTELKSTSLPPQAPIILHKEEKIKPTAKIKRSLGGFFEMLKTSQKSKEKPLAVKIETAKSEQILPKTQTIPLTQPPQKPKTPEQKNLSQIKPIKAQKVSPLLETTKNKSQQPIKIVHYSIHQTTPLPPKKTKSDTEKNEKKELNQNNKHKQDFSTTKLPQQKSSPKENFKNQKQSTQKDLNQNQQTQKPLKKPFIDLRTLKKIE